MEKKTGTRIMVTLPTHAAQADSIGYSFVKTAGDMERLQQELHQRVQGVEKSKKVYKWRPDAAAFGL